MYPSIKSFIPRPSVSNPSMSITRRQTLESSLRTHRATNDTNQKMQVALATTCTPRKCNLRLEPVPDWRQDNVKTMPVWLCRRGSTGAQERKRICPDPGLNRGPYDLQSCALPAELSRLMLLVSHAPGRALSVSHAQKAVTRHGPCLPHHHFATRQ
ncbi:hypothetical protein GQ42DRAFT_55637 [Ramicandelaber brevisporus]|nr:hypothetical protein GQ42DRAFT_55637 [Ramicandelaber brevisporus]